MARFRFIFVILVLTVIALAIRQYYFAMPGGIYRNPQAPVEDRVENLLSLLRTKEKLLLIGGGSYFGTHAINRVGIPSLKMSDGPFGIRGENNTVYAGGMALASSWDVDMAKRLGTSLGRDARARGIDIQLAPGMDMYRAPFGGRNFEYFGEDPILTGLIAANYVEGLQSQGVAATVKHFIVNEQEYDRNNISTTVDERTLREIYLKPFEIAIKQAHPWCVMDSYNLVNGVHATADDWLNNTVLKGEWGFKGLVMSDWLATHDTLGPFNGGMDLEMPGKPIFFTPDKLEPLLSSKKISETTLNDKVRRLLRMMISMGFYDHPQLDSSIPQDDPQSETVALQGAREGIVLLKNDAHLLPLDASKIKKIVVLGHNADPAVAVGGGSGHAEYLHSVSVLQGIKNQVGPDVDVVRVPWSTLPPTTDFSQSPSELKDAFAFTAYGAENNPPIPPDYVDQVKNADLAVVCVGFNSNVQSYWNHTDVLPDNEGEAVDRTYDLPPGQVNVILAVAKLNPHTVVILNAGGSVETASWIGQASTLVDAFYSGQDSGEALGEILFGKTVPSGKLTFSWEKRWEDCAAFGNYPNAGNHGKNDYSEGIFVGYRWFDSKNIAPLFPFGFGLSYTTFVYSNLQIQPASNGGLTATFSVQNTGTVAGDEVSQLYVSPPSCPTPRPAHELKGFARTSLQPGETKTVTISVGHDDLAYWNPGSKEWTVTPGDYTAQVGTSSRELPLHASFHE